MRSLIVLLCLSSLLTNGFAENRDTRKPNIVMILVDDLGFGDLSSHGAKDMQTPHIDALMKQGLRFDYNYANSSVCSPTRASLMTGRYPESAGVPGVIRLVDYNSWGYLNPKEEILPKRLDRAGYRTALIGKWHLGHQTPNLPNERGFHLFKGIRGGMVYNYYNYREHGSNATDLWHNETPINSNIHCTDQFSQWAMDYLDERSKQKHPFFLYLSYNAPHFPVQPPKEWLDKVLKREKGIGKRRARLVAFIEHLDHGIGQVIQKLKDSKQWNNTVVVFSSDNGGYLVDHANNGATRGGKGQMYEGGLRVATCVVWPNKIKQAKRVKTVALSMDLFPTFCDLAGATYPMDIDANSLLPTLEGKEQKELRKNHFFIRREGNMTFRGGTIHALRQGPWKLVQNEPGQKHELFNLEKDPLEKENVADKFPKIYKDLVYENMQQIQRGGQTPWMRPFSRRK